ncbi:hypothetical protein GCM10027060_21620 [Nesterenkonia halophila]
MDTGNNLLQSIRLQTLFIDKNIGCICTWFDDGLDHIGVLFDVALGGSATNEAQWTHVLDDIANVGEVVVIHRKHTFVDTTIVDFTSQEVVPFSEVSIFMKGEFMNTTHIR